MQNLIALRKNEIKNRTKCEDYDDRKEEKNVPQYSFKYHHIILSLEQITLFSLA